MKKFNLLFLFIIILQPILFAEEQEIIELPEVVITATKAEKEINKLPANISLITEKDIVNFQPQNISDVIQLKEGIDIQRLSGTAYLGHTFLKLRGLLPSRRPPSTLLLIDNNIQNRGIDGEINFSVIPIECIKKVEIIRGPYSAIYGANAASGVINILTKDAEKTQTKLSLAAGNFNYNKVSITRTFNENGLNYYLAAERTETDNYLADNNEKNRNYNEEKFRLKVNSKLLTATINYFRTIGGLGISSMLKLDEKIERKNVNFSIGYKNEYNVNFSWATSSDKYSTEDIINKIPTPTLKNTASYDTTINLFKNYNFKKNRILIGGECLLNKANWDIKKLDNKIITTNSKKVNNYAIYSQLDAELNNKTNILLGIRYDYHSRYKNNLSPKFGINYVLNNNTNIYFNYGYAFTAPTLFELYANNFNMGRIVLQGNSELVPGKTHSYETGINYKNFKINYFISTSKELITLKQTIGNIFTPYNINKVTTQGIETEFNYNMNKKIALFINYTYLYAKDKQKNVVLEYSPFNKINTGIVLKDTNFTFTLSTRYVSEQYYIEKNITKKLKDYFITDTNININKRINIIMKNLLNKKYQEYAGYSSPRRIFIINYSI